MYINSVLRELGFRLRANKIENRMCNRWKRWCMMHLSFTREIRGNLRVNGNSQRQLALQFANSTLNNTYHGKLQFERGDDEKHRFVNRTVKVLINLSCYTLRFSHFIISLYNLSRIQSEYHTWKLFEFSRWWCDGKIYACDHPAAGEIRHVQTHLLRIDGWSLYTGYSVVK